MEENDRIVSLFEKLYNGESWIDVPVQGTLLRISAADAGRRPLPNCNTIWEIVNHLIEWKVNVMQRLQGKILETPANNYIYPVPDTSETAWQATLLRFDTLHRQWIDFLKKIDTSSYQRIYPPNQMSYYEHIMGILQHEAYHLGQIVILAKPL
ncbi:DinB family protein [Algoriphagus aestuariicola]|uniref:DinB family protein n=1 Tax=Algoriphagus aestuariicola TaxID=1852016 RepID=A0ABS3BP11_9BACT|nr:DinB family protein [Algoriphagus aestuariicola]MBN7801043.1 DinB family protein [Algoriphagus aestuariicola]